MYLQFALPLIVLCALDQIGGRAPQRLLFHHWGGEIRTAAFRTNGVLVYHLHDFRLHSSSSKRGVCLLLIWLLRCLKKVWQNAHFRTTYFHGGQESHIGWPSTSRQRAEQETYWPQCQVRHLQGSDPFKFCEGTLEGRGVEVLTRVHRTVPHPSLSWQHCKHGLWSQAALLQEMDPVPLAVSECEVRRRIPSWSGTSRELVSSSHEWCREKYAQHQCEFLECILHGDHACSGWPKSRWKVAGNVRRRCRHIFFLPQEHAEEKP